MKKTRELAEEALRSQTLAFEAGLATGLDVVDAELALTRLQVADLKAHYDATIAWLGLLEASGEVANAGEMLKNVKPVEETILVESRVPMESVKPRTTVEATPAGQTTTESNQTAEQTPVTQPTAAEAPSAETPSAENPLTPNP